MDRDNSNLPGPATYMGNFDVLGGKFATFVATGTKFNIDKARDAVDPLSTMKFWTDPVQGRREVEQYVCVPTVLC